MAATERAVEGAGGRRGAWKRRVLARAGSAAMVNLGVRRVEDDVAAKHPVRPAGVGLGGLGVRGGRGSGGRVGLRPPR